MGKINRKDFLKKSAFLAVTAVTVPALLESCAKKSNNQPAEDPCTDTSNLSPSDLQTRTTFQYKGKSPYQDKYCTLCQFFIPPKGGAQCGTCQVVKGPINPDGYCNSFIKKQANSGS